jgi:hypothetical protein
MAIMTSVNVAPRDAGVDQLVLEPDATELDDFMDQMMRFTAEVAARFPNAQSSRTRLETV